jgi:hypothetical protein
MDKKPLQPVAVESYWRVMGRQAYEQAIVRRPHESALAYVLRLLFEATATIAVVCIGMGTVNLFATQGRMTEYWREWHRFGSYLGGASMFGLWLLNRRRRRAEEVASMAATIERLQAENDELRTRLKEREPEGWTPATAPENLAF